MSRFFSFLKIWNGLGWRCYFFNFMFSHWIKLEAVKISSRSSPLCPPSLSLHWTPAEPPTPPSRCTAGSGSPSPAWQLTPSPRIQSHCFHWCGLLGEINTVPRMVKLPTFLKHPPIYSDNHNFQEPCDVRKLTEKCLTVEPGDPRQLHRDVIDQHLLFADRYV